jgi:phage recombination protein Bet
MGTTIAMATINNTISLWEDNNKLEEIRKLFAPKLSEIEFQFFVGMGKASNLNPFTREIWAVKYQDNVAAQVFIGRDGYRKAAQRHPDYDYHQCDAVYENDLFKISRGEVEHAYTLKDRGKLVGSYCIVKRRSAERPMYVFVELSEYSTGKSLWHPQTGKPATMIKKVAEAQCLRACFQDLLGGTYGEEEFARTEPNVSLVTNKGITQTEKLKQVLNVDTETGEIIGNTTPIKIHNTGRDDMPINDEQLDELTALMTEKDFNEERLTKALKYYNVMALEELTDAQARLFLLQLEKI